MDIPNRHTINLSLRTEDVDLSERWTMSGILTAMQTSADVHATLIGAGKQQVEDKGFYWVAARLRVDMEHYPVFGDAVSVLTWPGEHERITFPRYFRFFDSGDRVLGNACIQYMLMDIETRRFVAPVKSGIYSDDFVVWPEKNPLPDKIRAESGGEPVSNRTVVYSDIDLNGHMNNARYAQWICDLFPGERFRTSPMQRLQINFISDGVEGRRIDLYRREDDAGFTVSGIDRETGKPVFESAGQWMAAQ